MSALTPDLAEQIVAAGRKNAAALAAALRPCLAGDEVELHLSDAASVEASLLADTWDGPALAFVAQVGDVGAALVLPEAAGLLPDWLARPDAAGRERLKTAAADLWPHLLPEHLTAEATAAGRVDHLAQLLDTAELSEHAVRIALKLTSGDQQAEAHLVWPCQQPSVLLRQVSHSGAADASPADAEPAGQRTIGGNSSSRPRSLSWEALPPYARHLLRIEVPVTVNLVSKKLSVQELIELSPGAMISFEKSCDGPLELTVGNQCIAVGSAVKVGECFGLEISEMTMPTEHFVPIRKVG